MKLSIQKLEDQREENRREQKIIGWYLLKSNINQSFLSAGQVLDLLEPQNRIHIIKSRLVRFSWQRGVKIGKQKLVCPSSPLLFDCLGQGNFGKVYTAINNETGDIMAMKEMPLQQNDHKTLR